jgi:hypothetical protein
MLVYRHLPNENITEVFDPTTPTRIQRLIPKPFKNSKGEPYSFPHIPTSYSGNLIGSSLGLVYDVSDSVKTKVVFNLEDELDKQYPDLRRLDMMGETVIGAEQTLGTHRYFLNSAYAQGDADLLSRITENKRYRPNLFSADRFHPSGIFQITSLDPSFIGTYWGLFDTHQARHVFRGSVSSMYRTTPPRTRDPFIALASSGQDFVGRIQNGYSIDLSEGQLVTFNPHERNIFHSIGLIAFDGSGGSMGKVIVGSSGQVLIAHGNHPAYSLTSFHLGDVRKKKTSDHWVKSMHVINGIPHAVVENRNGGPLLINPFDDSEPRELTVGSTLHATSDGLYSFAGDKECTTIRKLNPLTLKGEGDISIDGVVHTIASSLNVD